MRKARRVCDRRASVQRGVGVDGFILPWVGIGGSQGDRPGNVPLLTPA